MNHLQGWRLGAALLPLDTSSPLHHPHWEAPGVAVWMVFWGRASSHPPPPWVQRARPCVCPLRLTTHPITTLSEGMGARASGGGGALGFCCPALPWLPNLDDPPLSHLPPLFLLQMEPHPEEVPVVLGPDLLTVRKPGVSRTHSLPNDSYMCRDGSTAEGSPGHGGWGLPKAQSGTRSGSRLAWLTPGISSLPKLSPDLGGNGGS